MVIIPKGWYPMTLHHLQIKSSRGHLNGHINKFTHSWTNGDMCRKFTVDTHIPQKMSYFHFRHSEFSSCAVISPKCQLCTQDICWANWHLTWHQCLHGLFLSATLRTLLGQLKEEYCVVCSLKYSHHVWCMVCGNLLIPPHWSPIIVMWWWGRHKNVKTVCKMVWFRWVCVDM